MAQFSMEIMRLTGSVLRGNQQLVNHLGIDLGDAPEEMLGRLDSGHIDRSLIVEGKRPCFR